MVKEVLQYHGGCREKTELTPNAIEKINKLHTNKNRNSSEKKMPTLERPKTFAFLLSRADISLTVAYLIILNFFLRSFLTFLGFSNEIRPKVWF